ncbi:MATE family efflux transporter [Turicibacter sanguinis]|uniref:MATE family efflux transporter n=1 Tax=Turicibacter sanguinis TaxID=154288 RepID=UPI0018AB5F51|nr:MATE family efflux transporter [Turicibacter sanguinis]MDB8552794.1 MATE family efflux transporter [Turicibacter sanguinis]
MNIQLSEHFNYKKLIRFTLPSITMMVFTSLYGVIDGLFISNIVGSQPFAAVNLIMPVLMIFGAFGFMIGTGGSALIAKTLGEGEKELANEYFSLLVYISIICGIALSIIGLIFIRPIALLLGAEEEILPFCITYGRILLSSLTFFILQNSFQSYFVASGKPQMGLFLSLAAGLTNIIFDFLFIYVFRFGVAGAATATALSQIVGGLIPLFYFGRKNNSLLRLGKTKFYGNALLKSCINGSSEMMTNLSISLVNMLYNLQLMKYIGANGVAAYGILMYAGIIFSGIYTGYAIGSAPLISYHYGAENNKELKNLFKKSLTLIVLASVIITLLAELFTDYIAKIFVGYDTELMSLTIKAFHLFALSYLFSGINIFGSAFFTALNNGVISAIVSFLRTLVFQIIMIFLLPALFGIDAIWLSVVAAELLALIVTFFFFKREQESYHYL